MENNTPDDLQAEWIAMNGFILLQDQLDSETDEFRYKILVALLFNKLKEFKAGAAA